MNDKDKQKVFHCIKYILNRIQTTTELGYRCGYGTQIFAELCQAEAALTGRPLDEIERNRKRDLRPAHIRDELPREQDLRKEVVELRG